jgi:YHS domain-containing protein
MSPIRLAAAVVLAAAAIACGPKSTTGPTPPAGDRVLVNVDAQGVGLGGHDPVAYLATNAATMGSAEHTSSHGGATYHFASAENKAAFDAAAATHAPGFGGYCAYAASQNRLSPSDPTVFAIHEGQLLVFTNAEFLGLFQQDAAGNKAKADQNWPGLVAQHGKAPTP